MPEQVLTHESLVEFFGEEEFKKLCNHEAGHALVALFVFPRYASWIASLARSSSPVPLVVIRPVSIT